MANHQTNFTSNFGEMGETGNAAFVLNVNGIDHTYHPIGSDVMVDVATVRRIPATAPNLAQSIAAVIAAGGYPVLVYDGSEYGYIRTTSTKYVFTCIASLNTVKQAEVDIQNGTITAAASDVGGISILSSNESDLFVKIGAVLALDKVPIILDNGAYYHLITKASTVAQFARDTSSGTLQVISVDNNNQITSSSFTFLESTGDASNATSTFTKASDDTSTMTSGAKLSVIFTAISSFFASLKALAFKDKASYNDLSSRVQSSLNKADSALQSHQSVADNNPTLAWGATSKVGTVGSTDLQVTMPSNPASGKADKASITGATKCKITYNSQGIVTAGADLSASDIPNLSASKITSGQFGTDCIADDAITADKVKDNETLPVNITGNSATATTASKSVFYKANSLGNYTRYFKIGNLTRTSGGQSDCVFLASTPDGIGGNIPTTYIVTASNRNGVPLVRYSRITPEKNVSQDNASFGYIVQSNGSINILMYRPAYSGAISITMIREGDLVSDFDQNADGTGYVTGARYETVMVTQQVGSTSIPVYVDSKGKVQPCTPSSMSVGHASALTPGGSAGQVLISAGSGSDPVWGDVASVQTKHSNTITSGSGTVYYSSPADAFAIAITYDKANSRAHLTVYNATNGRQIYVSLRHSGNLTPVPYGESAMIASTLSEYNLMDLDILCMGIGDNLPVFSFTIAIYVNESKCTYTIYDRMLYSL